MNTLGFIGNLSMGEIAVIAIIAVLLFGRRLPEVGRSIGKGIVEFKRGLTGVDEIVAPSGVGAGASAGVPAPASTHASRAATLQATIAAAGALPKADDAVTAENGSANDRPAVSTSAVAGATSTV